MESHPDVAKGFVKGDKIKHDQMWVELTNQLNACGPPNRDTATWKKTWCDWKRSIKTRLAENKALLNKTGGGQHQQHFLTQVEERLAVICNIFHAVEGISNAKSFGGNKNKNSGSSEDTPDFEEAQIVCDIQTTSTQMTPLPKSQVNVPATPKKRKRFCEDVEEIIEEEKENFKYIGEKLGELNKVLKENTKYMRNLSKNIDEIRSLQRKKLEEMKRHNLEIEKLKRIKMGLTE